MTEEHSCTLQWVALPPLKLHLSIGDLNPI